MYLDNTAKENPKIISIACGESFSMAVTESGHLYTWGSGNEGALGQGTCEDFVLPNKVKVDHVTQVAGGAYHSIVLADLDKNPEAKSN